MVIDVYTTHGQGPKLNDFLQKSGEEISLSIKEYKDSSPLGTGEILVSEKGVFIGAKPGQQPLDFSWEKKMQKWRGNSLKHPLKKALKVERDHEVIDATVGFGQDSALLLELGAIVVGYERNPLIFVALKLSQWKENFFFKRLTLNYGSVQENAKRSSIYFDPMYDDGNERKAKPTKEMDVFHHIVQADTDAMDEAKRLRELTDRLVIKRSPRDKPLLENVNSQWESKALRLDLYL